MVYFIDRERFFVTFLPIDHTVNENIRKLFYLVDFYLPIICKSMTLICKSMTYLFQHASEKYTYFIMSCIKVFVKPLSYLRKIILFIMLLSATFPPFYLCDVKKFCGKLYLCCIKAFLQRENEIGIIRR